MSRRCAVTQKGVLVGNNVSHANNKTRRRFLPNLQETRVYSEALGRMVSIRVTPHGLRTLEANGGFDAFVTSRAKTKLSPELAKLKKVIESKLK